MGVTGVAGVEGAGVVAGAWTFGSLGAGGVAELGGVAGAAWATGETSGGGGAEASCVASLVSAA